MRTRIFAALLAFSFCAATPLYAQSWPSKDPAASGWSMAKLKEAEDYAASLRPIAVMIVQDGNVVAGWGDTARKVNAASVRKSLLGALYGLAVTENRKAIQCAPCRSGYC